MIAKPALKANRLAQLRAHRGFRGLLLALPLAALVSIFTVSGLRGVDFGYHWDELDWQVNPVRDMVASGLLLPRASIYPSLTKWLVLLPALPTALRESLRPRPDPRRVQRAMTAVIAAPAYLFTVRRLFVLVCALAIVWVYGAALAFRRTWWEALIAAAGVGLSWEYAYHARWVATDSILVQFSALTLFMLALFHRTTRPGWLYAAAVSAGLGTATKYPGAILLVPVMLSSVLTLSPHNLRAQALRLFALGGLSVAVYLVASPSTLMDPFTFVEQSRWIAGYYRTAHHAGHWVPNVWQGWKVVLLYLSLAYFSPFRLLAVPWFATAILGAIVWIRSDRRVGAVVVCFPIAFLVFFCFTYLVVIIRNYLVVGPFLAILAARGIGEIFGWLRPRWARAALAAVVGLALTVQAVWLVGAGESIRHYDQDAYVKSAVAYTAAHPGVRFKLSPKVRALAARQHLTMAPNVTEGRDAQAVVFFAIDEGPGSWNFKTNDPFQIVAVFGPRELNFDWYCGWLGRDRVVIMPIDKARATGVPLAR
jgi:dolichyl-phosphate-mannose-protein mannosyltransferase